MVPNNDMPPSRHKLRKTKVAPESKKCKVEDCDRLTTPRSAHGYCKKHYTRWHIHGDPYKVSRSPNATTIEERRAYRRAATGRRTEKVHKKWQLETPTKSVAFQLVRKLRVNRIEVINHASTGMFGRSLVKWEDQDFRVRLSMQDEGRTLKIFLEDLPNDDSQSHPPE